jgi:rhomboid protease GluP
VSNTGLIAYTNKGIFSRNAEIKITIEGEVALIKSASTGNEMADWGFNKKNVAAFINRFNELRNTLATDALAEKYEVLKELMVPDEEDSLKLPPPTTMEQINGFFSIFKPVSGYYVTPIILNINIFLFILMAINGD